jgi:hypothetical protein
MKLVRHLTAVALAAAFAAPLVAQQAIQERLDLNALQRIRDEGLNHSRVDSLVGYLTDVIGPRVTGSTGMRRAQDWAAQTMRSWGLANVAIEPWDSLFGRGWDRVAFSARWLEPYPQPLYAMPFAWSGSTRGPVTCAVKVAEIRDTTDFARYDGQLRGACVLLLRPSGNQPAGIREIPPEWNPPAQRIDADSVLAWAARPLPTRPPGAPQAGPQQGQFQRFQSLQARMGAWIQAQAPAAILQASNWTYGLILGSGGPQARMARDSANFEPLPALVLSHEHAGQIYRDIRRGVNVRLEINVQNRFTNPDKREYTVVAEIPGTDKANELVMVGAHLDSWYGGTGATDDAAGSAVMMEALRILKTLNLPMRRTVRIGLWSGEEQGLLGSAAYVRAHRAEMDRVSAYLNVDNGTGRLRGVWAQSNVAVVPIFEQILAPFRDLGIVAVAPGNTGGTDHLSFDRIANVPGFQFIQDPIDYGTRTHHSQVDTYERLVMDDLRQAATIVAWSVYTIANREEMMPRKPAPPATGTN